MYKQPEADIGFLYFPNDFIIVMGNLIVPSCKRKSYPMEFSDIYKILFSLPFANVGNFAFFCRCAFTMKSN